MKFWISRWLNDSSRKSLRSEQRRHSAHRSKITTDELEQRLILEADNWVEQYEPAKTSQAQKVQLRSHQAEYSSHFSTRFRTQKMVPVIALLAVGLVILCGVQFYYISSTKESAQRHETAQTDQTPNDVEIQSLIASVQAIDEICDKVAAGIRRREISLRILRVDTIVEPSLVHVGEQLKQPGRQYGRSLAWIEHRLQLRDPAAVNSSDESQD